MRHIIASLVLSIVGLAACGTAQAEEKGLSVNDGALTKYFDIQKFSQDDVNGTMSWVLKAKVQVTVTTEFRVEFRDEDGVPIQTSVITMTPTRVGFDVGQVMRGTAKVPANTLEKTKSIVVVGGIIR